MLGGCTEPPFFSGSVPYSCVVILRVASCLFLHAIPGSIEVTKLVGCVYPQASAKKPQALSSVCKILVAVVAFGGSRLFFALEKCLTGMGLGGCHIASFGASQLHRVHKMPAAGIGALGVAMIKAVVGRVFLAG